MADDVDVAESFEWAALSRLHPCALMTIHAAISSVHRPGGGEASGEGRTGSHRVDPAFWGPENTCAWPALSFDAALWPYHRRLAHRISGGLLTCYGQLAENRLFAETDTLVLDIIGPWICRDSCYSHNIAASQHGRGSSSR